MARTTKLTPDVHAKIVSYIRAGAFDWVSARACGVDPRTFYNWLEWGKGSKRAPYFQFFQDVAEARAEARTATEIEVRRTQPLAWLRFGPGRDRPGEPGWTDSTVNVIQGPVEVRVVYINRNPNRSLAGTPGAALEAANGDRREPEI